MKLVCHPFGVFHPMHYRERHEGEPGFVFQKGKGESTEQKELASEKEWEVVEETFFETLETFLQSPQQPVPKGFVEGKSAYEQLPVVAEAIRATAKALARKGLSEKEIAKRVFHAINKTELTAKMDRILHNRWRELLEPEIEALKEMEQFELGTKPAELNQKRAHLKKRAGELGIPSSFTEDYYSDASIDSKFRQSQWLIAQLREQIPDELFSDSVSHLAKDLEEVITKQRLLPLLEIAPNAKTELDRLLQKHTPEGQAALKGWNEFVVNEMTEWIENRLMKEARLLPRLAAISETERKKERYLTGHPFSTTLEPEIEEIKAVFQLGPETLRKTVMRVMEAYGKKKDGEQLWKDLVTMLSEEFADPDRKPALYDAWADHLDFRRMEKELVPKELRRAA